MPSWIRSSSERSWPWYFFAIETTRRRFELTSRSFASRSPRSIAFAMLDLLLGGEQGMAADLVEEELERVRGRAGDVAVLHLRLLDAVAAAVVRDLEPA